MAGSIPTQPLSANSNNCAHCDKPLTGEWHVEMAHRRVHHDKKFLTVKVHLEHCSDKMRSTGWVVVVPH